MVRITFALKNIVYVLLIILMILPSNALALQYRVNGNHVESSDSNIIAMHGEITEPKDEYEIMDRESKKKAIVESLKGKTLSEKYSHGSKLWYGHDYESIIVVFRSKRDATKFEMEEIYSIIDDEAQKNGWQNIPVKFVFAEPKDILRIESTLAMYGTIPPIKNDEQRYEWYTGLQNVIDVIDKEYDCKDIYPKPSNLSAGSLVICELSGGYILMGFIDNSTVDKQRMDEIYTKIDEEAKKRGIQNVPVKFQLVSESIFDPITTDEPEPMDTITLIKTLPAFGLLGGLISLLVGWMLIKQA